MPSKKKKYNTRFPASRIKKIMQTDEEIGKVAQAVPIIISRTLELFVESLLKQSKQITQSRNAKTLTPSHMKQCILSESRFDFLKDLVKNVPDASVQEDNENNAMENEALDYSIVKEDPTPETPIDFTIEPKYDLAANYYTEQSTSNIRTPVIQFNSKHSEKLNSPVVNKPSRVTSTITSEDSSKFNFPSDSRCPLPPSIGGDTSASSSAQSTPTGDKINFQYGGDHKKLNFSIESLVNSSSSSSSNEQPKLHLDFSKLSSNLTPPSSNSNLSPTTNHIARVNDRTQMPPLIPITQHYAAQSSGDNLYIDEDYDN